MKPVHHFLFFIGLCVLAVACFFLFILLLFAYAEWTYFYPLIFLLIYIWLWVAKAFQKSWRYPLGALGAAVAILVGYMAYTESYRQTPTVEAEINTYDYRPFREYSQIARLNQDSSLKLTVNLPKLDGSTALYPMYSAFATAVYPAELKDDYSRAEELVQVSKTGEAYERLLNGEVDVIFVPAPSKEHLSKAQDKGVAFKLTPIGKEAFVFFVNQKNPVNNLQVEQIKQIYAGNVTNWRDVGGENEKIRAFQRPQNSGSQTALQKIMGDTPLMVAPREDVPQGMGGIINQVADYRNFDNALGFSFLFYSTQMVNEKQIKLLSINGVSPNHDNIRNQMYPFAYEFYAVTLGNESPETKQLIEWIASPQGQELVLKSGYVPMK